MGVKSGSHSPSQGSSSPSAVGIALHCLITREKCIHHSSQLLGKIDAQMELRAGVAEPVVYILDVRYLTPRILQCDFFFFQGHQDPWQISKKKKKCLVCSKFDKWSHSMKHIQA